MKVCDYCGRENEDDAICCRECGTDEFKKPRGDVSEEAPQSDGAESSESDLVVSDTATICAWCGRENAAGSVTCYECGSSLKRPKAKPEKQPKAADRNPPRWQFRTLTADEMKLDLVTLLTCRSIVEADVVAGQLEGIGISAFIPDEFVAQVMAWNINGLGYVRVQVSPGDYERAKDFLLESVELAEPDNAPDVGPASPGGGSSVCEEPPSVS